MADKNNSESNNKMDDKMQIDIKANDELNKMDVQIDIKANDELNKIDNKIMDFFKIDNKICIDKFFKYILQLLSDNFIQNEKNCDDLYYLGIYYQFIDINYKLAEKYYSEAADKGCVMALHNLGKCYEQEKKYSQAEKCYLRAVEKGHTLSTYGLEKYYKRVGKYYSRKKYLDMETHKENEYDVMVSVGKYCMYNKNYGSAEANFTIVAACARNIRAMYHLAILKYIVNKPPEQAIDWLFDLLNINNKHHKAMRLLGIIYEKEKKYDLAKKYWLMAIDYGNIAALNDMGNYYEKKEKNYDLAKKYFAKAIKKGNSDAMNDFGEYYQLVEKNFDLAKKYYLMGAEKGNSRALCSLGIYYLSVEQDYNIAKKYHIQAIMDMKNDTIDTLIRYISDHTLPADYLSDCLSGVIKNNPEIRLRHLLNTCYDDAGLNYNIQIKHAHILKNKIIDSLCKLIDNEFLCIANFEFCVNKIIEYFYRESFKSFESQHKLEYKDYFMEYIGRLYYCKYNEKNNEKNKIKMERKKCLGIFLGPKEKLGFFGSLKLFYKKVIESSQSFYKGYIEKKYAFGGKGYEKAGKHFEMEAEEQQNLNKK